MGTFEFKKKFGQNFLTDKNLLNEIVEKSGITENDTAVEIGVGKGALTEILSKKAKNVFAFEIDKELFEYLTEKFDSTNVNLIFEDIMNFDDEKLEKLVNGQFFLVANLPYYITSPIITRFLQNKDLKSLTVMVQEEVADRIIASPKTKDYGVLTIICNIFGKPQKVMRVNRKMFFPVPNVDSAVVRIDKYTDFDLGNYKQFIAFVKKAFSMRRKKLSSNLENDKISKNDIENMLEELGFSRTCRAEELSVEKFKELFDIFKDKNWL